MPDMPVDHVAGCALCSTPFDFPANHHNGTRIDGDTQINGSMNVYAHWRVSPAAGQEGIVIRYHLNVHPDYLATPQTEGQYGRAYWPTHRPVGYDNLDNRFFLTRNNIPALGISGGIFNEYNYRYTTERLQIANVPYEQRFWPYITRNYNYNLNIVSSGHLVHQRLPRNPRRAGYVFVGWSTNPDLPPLNAVGNPTPVVSSGTPLPVDPTTSTNIYNVSMVLSTANNVPPGSELDLFAVWAPAFELIVDGNGNTFPSTHTYFVRYVGIGFRLYDMLEGSRWGATAPLNGSMWFQHAYFTWGENRAWRNHFGRVGYQAIGTHHAFHTDRYAREDLGSIIMGPRIDNPISPNAMQTRFNDTFFNLRPENQLHERSPGIYYLRVYKQWASHLIFYGNHSSIDAGASGPSRWANITYGYSVNDMVNPASRHPFLQDVAQIWGPGWAGSAGVNGTRGGWPRNPPGVADVNGGDWNALFSGPATGHMLVGWHRSPDGICPPGEDWWVTADTVWYGGATVYAIWHAGIVFHPGVGGDEVNMNQVRIPTGDPNGSLFRLATIGGPVPPPVPSPGSNYIPVWPGRIFRNWYPVITFNINVPPFPTPLGTTVNYLRRYYAVWTAPVTFHATGPGGLVPGGTIPGQGATFVLEHAMGWNITPHANAPERPGPHGWINTGQWWTPDASAPGGRRIYCPVNGPPVMQAMDVFTQWTGTITFRPGHNRGRLDDATLPITRVVYEGLTLGDNDPTERLPGVSYVVHPPWPNDPGIVFGGWRRVNASGDPVNPDGTPLLPGDPLPPLWSNQDVLDMVLVDYAVFFEAVWSLRLEFYKVGSTENEAHPFGYNPLPDAGFALDRYIPGTGWVQAYPALPLTYIESDAGGRVFMGSTFAPLLELPRTNTTIDFRLRETHAPSGYRTPSGHWVVTVSYQTGTMPIFTEYDGNPAFFPNITVTSGPLTGIRQVVGNVASSFDFWKTDHNGIKQPGAEFLLLVWNGTNAPTPGLITNDMIGPGANQWSVEATAKSTLDDAMSFTLLLDRHYQLIETVPPRGFQMPMGQWYITVNDTAPFLTITPVGGMPMPDIEPCTDPETFNIHNWPEFTLPLTGDMGVSLLLALAGALVSAVAVVILVVHKKYKAVECRTKQMYKTY